MCQGMVQDCITHWKVEQKVLQAAGNCFRKSWPCEYVISVTQIQSPKVCVTQCWGGMTCEQIKGRETILALVNRFILLMFCVFHGFSVHWALSCHTVWHKLMWSQDYFSFITDRVIKRRRSMDPMFALFVTVICMSSSLLFYLGGVFCFVLSSLPQKHTSNNLETVSHYPNKQNLDLLMGQQLVDNP